MKMLQVELVKKFPAAHSPQPTDIAVQSSTLDPRFRDLPFLDEEERSRMQKLVCDKAAAMKVKSQEDKPEIEGLFFSLSQSQSRSQSMSHTRWLRQRRTLS